VRRTGQPDLADSRLPRDAPAPNCCSRIARVWFADGFVLTGFFWVNGKLDSVWVTCEKWSISQRRHIRQESLTSVLSSERCQLYGFLVHTSFFIDVEPLCVWFEPYPDLVVQFNMSRKADFRETVLWSSFWFLNWTTNAVLRQKLNISCCSGLSQSTSQAG